MNNISKKIISAVIMLSLAVVMGGCNNDVVEKSYLHDDDLFIKNHTSGILEWESTEYEEVVNAPRYFSIGPSEPLYRGVIVLTDEYADEIMEAYEWAPDDSEIEFSKVDISELDGPWLTSDEFSSDVARSEYESFEYLVFNGEALLFTLKTN
ncbi:MAG: hypothetical protein IJ757_08665 [Clostridiales bacterium]|nr:hypothetical protein [Clostridiales bacterium]